MSFYNESPMIGAVKDCLSQTHILRKKNIAVSRLRVKHILMLSYVDWGNRLSPVLNCIALSFQEHEWITKNKEVKLSKLRLLCCVPIAAPPDWCSGRISLSRQSSSRETRERVISSNGTCVLHKNDAATYLLDCLFLSSTLALPPTTMTAKIKSPNLLHNGGRKCSVSSSCSCKCFAIPWVHFQLFTKSLGGMPL